MDDWVILAPTRWKLRQAINAVNQVMANLLVEKYPDKTFIGRISRGFDFLGYWFTPSGLGIALKTLERCFRFLLFLDYFVLSFFSLAIETFFPFSFTDFLHSVV